MRVPRFARVIFLRLRRTLRGTRHGSKLTTAGNFVRTIRPVILVLMGTQADGQSCAWHPNFFAAEDVRV